MGMVTGLVESKARNGKSIKVGGVWYSAFKKESLDGIEWKDTVSFMAEQKGEYNNVKGNVTKISAGEASIGISDENATGNTSSGSKGYRKNGEEGGFPLHPLSYERALDRRNAIQCAVAYACATGGRTTAELLALAREFEAYTTGDEERLMAEKMFNAS